MSTALVLPRFSELFKELYFDHENLNLAPLRTFPESFSRESPPRLQPKAHDVLGRRNGHNLVIHTFSNSMGSEASSPTYTHSSTSRGSCSRDSSPSDETVDCDSEPEGAQPQCPLEMILFHSPEQKGKSSSSQHPKPKKVKYHFCEICQKPFPRPSGLRAHMNMHTKEKPFECGFPGCPKRFSVSSNAKRHLRTHGVGLSPSDEPTPLPYVVDFEEPVVVSMDCDDSSGPTPQPLSLRWMPLGVGSRRSHKMQNRTELS